MLGKSKMQTYYTISSCYNQNEKKLITSLCETDGSDFFEFIASFEQILDQELTSSIKKLKGYSFSAKELAELKDKLTQATCLSIKSILNENNIKQDDIDFICLEHVNIADGFKLNISTHLYNEFNIPVIFNQDLTDQETFLKKLASSKNIEEGLIINLHEDFDIYKLNNNVSKLDTSIGYSVLRYLVLYCNIDDNQISYLISQGEVDQSIINKLKDIDSLELLQKELINLIVFSKISTGDKLKTAFFAIKSLLLKNLAEFDSNTHIMLIGNTSSIELLNQVIKEKFENTTFLKNQSQRQNTLKNEHMAYLGCKKYVIEDYNNGVTLS